MLVNQHNDGRFRPPAFEYERAGGPVEVYFKQIDKLVKYIMRHKSNEEELTKYLLLHCSKYRELEKEMKMRNLETSKGLRTMIKKLDQVRTEINNVNIIGSYSSVVKNNNIIGRLTPRRVVLKEIK